MLCEYGCGREAKYQLKNGKWCCEKSCNSCPSIKEKCSIGLKKAYKEGRKNTDHLNKEGVRNWAKGKNKFTDSRVKSQDGATCIEDYLENKIPIGSTTLKEKLLQLNMIEYKCDCCGISDWNGKEIKLELHHKDGNNNNNNLSNLQLLCPNCHSQTETFKGRNVNTKGRWIDLIDENILLEYLKECGNIRKTLLKYINDFSVNLPLSGTIYKYIKEIANKNNINIYQNMINKNKEKYRDYNNKNKYIVNSKEKDYINKAIYINNNGKRIIVPSLKEAEEVAYIVNKLIDSNIDFNKFGWVKRASKIIGCSENQSRRWIKHWCPWLLENCYIRKHK